jgi:hypothetical protein
MEREPIPPQIPPPLPTTDALPFASVVCQAEPTPARSTAVVLVAVLIVLSIAAVISLASAASSTHAGEINATPPFLLSATDLAWLSIWIVCTTTIATACVWAHGRVRWLATGGLIAILAAVPVSCAHRPYPDDAYLAGFTSWARGHVNTTAIRQWNSSLQQPAKPVNIPPAQYPPAVASLAPDAVEQHPTGVVLQWGRQATWSTSRKVFVGNSDMSPPPADPFHLWHQVLPGLYASRGASD